MLVSSRARENARGGREGSWAEERESKRGVMRGLTLALSQTQEPEGGVGETSGYDRVQQGGARPGSGVAERDSST